MANSARVRRRQPIRRQHYSKYSHNDRRMVSIATIKRCVLWTTICIVLLLGAVVNYVWMHQHVLYDAVQMAGFHAAPSQRSVNHADAILRQMKQATPVPYERHNGTTFQCPVTGNSFTVGRLGDAVKHAREFGMIQRMKRIPRRQWDIIDTAQCWTQEKDGRLVSEREIAAAATGQLQAPQASRLASPNAILIGVQKGGTTALFSYLQQHPKVASSKKELYFLDEYIDARLLSQAKAADRPGIVDGVKSQSSSRMHQLEIRQAYSTALTHAAYGPKHRTHSAQTRRQKSQQQQPDNRILLDFTPNYVVQSNRLPQRLMCIAPCAKILLLLRDPIERARSNYDMKQRFHRAATPVVNEHGKPLPTLQQYIRNDIAALRETGVLQDWSVVDFDAFFASQAQHEAWRAYIHQGLNSPIGWGLYAIQVHHYLSVFRRYGKPLTDFMVVPSMDLKMRPHATCGMVQDFLNISRIGLDEYSQSINSAKVEGSYAGELGAELQRELKELFRPYDEKLKEQLSANPFQWRGDTWEDFTIHPAGQ